MTHCIDLFPLNLGVHINHARFLCGIYCEPTCKYGEFDELITQLTFCAHELLMLEIHWRYDYDIRITFHSFRSELFKLTIVIVNLFSIFFRKHVTYTFHQTVCLWYRQCLIAIYTTCRNYFSKPEVVFDFNGTNPRYPQLQWSWTEIPFKTLFLCSITNIYIYICIRTMFWRRPRVKK